MTVLMMTVLLLLDLKRSWESRIRDYTSVVFRRIGCVSREAVGGNSLGPPPPMMGWRLGGARSLGSFGM
jgi:hypothetical protein